MAKLMMLNKERIKSVRDVVNKSFDPISEKVDMIADKIVSQSLVSLVDPETVETKLFQPSVYQQAIFDYISLLVRDKNVGHVGQKHVVIEAVAGCISGDSIIYTDNGLITIKELYSKKLKNIKVACSNKNGGTEFKEIDEYFKLEDKNIIKITTKFGFELKCTPEHKLLTLDKNGVLGFVEAKSLNINDVISIYYGANSFGENQKMRWDIGQSLISDYYLSKEELEKLHKISKGVISYGSTGGCKRDKNIACTYPYIMNEELAEFLGYFISEGNLHHEITVSISNTDDKINKRIDYLYKNLFNLDSNIIIEKRRENTDYGRTVNSVGLSRFLNKLDLNRKSKNKHIPFEILRSSKEIHISFLKALFSGDGYVVKDSKMVGYSSMSENLCKQIQLMLLNLGIYSNLDDKVAYCNDKYCGKSYSISISGNNAISYRDLIGFTLEYRQNELIEICKHIEEDGTWNSRILIGLSSYISKIYDEFKKHGNWGDIREYYKDFDGNQTYKCYSASEAIIKRGCSDIRGIIIEKRCPSKQKLYKILIAMKECNYMDEYKYLMNLYDLNVEYESIESLEYEKEDVYDLNVRDFHHYIANGFIVHNSGKTRTIEEATKLIPHNMSVCFLAFNRHIAEELKKRAPSNVRAMTLNSLGHNVVMSAMRANGKSVFLEPRKVYDIVSLLLKKEYSRFTQEEMDNIIPVVVRIVSLFKATRMTVSDSSLNYLMDRYNIFNEVDNNVLIQICAKVLYQCTRILERHESSQIDFGDQIWLPVQLNLPVFPYDFVFIDETQDLNAAQLELALRACKKDGSIIAVGDRNQSIYGFRGADVDAIPRIIKRLNAKVFPLSITYRCPVKHVELAKHFVPEIEAAPWAIEGEIIEIKDSDMEQYVRAGDLAICRTNAPLVSPCFALIKKGIKATIRGRDIGEGLITLIKKIKGSSMDEFSIRLDTWASKEREKLEKKGASIESVMDKYETLLVLMEDCDDVDCLIAKIKTIFSDDVSAVIFSSVHRAKGLEAETKDNSVYVLYPNLMPSQWAKKDWELIQERNLQYVAYTRAKNKMYMVW